MSSRAEGTAKTEEELVPPVASTASAKSSASALSPWSHETVLVTEEDTCLEIGVETLEEFVVERRRLSGAEDTIVRLQPPSEHDDLVLANERQAKVDPEHYLLTRTLLQPDPRHRPAPSSRKATIKVGAAATTVFSPLRGNAAPAAVVSSLSSAAAAADETDEGGLFCCRWTAPLKTFLSRPKSPSTPCTRRVIARAAAAEERERREQERKKETSRGNLAEKERILAFATGGGGGCKEKSSDPSLATSVDEVTLWSCDFSDCTVCRSLSNFSTSTYTLFGSRGGGGGRDESVGHAASVAVRRSEVEEEEEKNNKKSTDWSSSCSRMPSQKAIIPSQQQLPQQQKAPAASSCTTTSEQPSSSSASRQTVDTVTECIVRIDDTPRTESAGCVLSGIWFAASAGGGRDANADCGGGCGGGCDGGGSTGSDLYEQELQKKRQKDQHQQKQMLLLPQHQEAEGRGGAGVEEEEEEEENDEDEDREAKKKRKEDERAVWGLDDRVDYSNDRNEGLSRWSLGSEEYFANERREAKRLAESVAAAAAAAMVGHKKVLKDDQNASAAAVTTRPSSPSPSPPPTPQQQSVVSRMEQGKMEEPVTMVWSSECKSKCCNVRCRNYFCTDTPPPPPPPSLLPEGVQQLQPPQPPQRPRPSSPSKRTTTLKLETKTTTMLQQMQPQVAAPTSTSGGGVGGGSSPRDCKQCFIAEKTERIALQQQHLHHHHHHQRGRDHGSEDDDDDHEEEMEGEDDEEGEGEEGEGEGGGGGGKKEGTARGKELQKKRMMKRSTRVEEALVRPSSRINMALAYRRSIAPEFDLLLPRSAPPSVSMSTRVNSSRGRSTRNNQHRQQVTSVSMSTNLSVDGRQVTLKARSPSPSQRSHSPAAQQKQQLQQQSASAERRNSSNRRFCKAEASARSMTDESTVWSLDERPPLPLPAPKRPLSTDNDHRGRRSHGGEPQLEADGGSNYSKTAAWKRSCTKQLWYSDNKQSYSSEEGGHLSDFYALKKEDVIPLVVAAAAASDKKKKMKQTMKETAAALATKKAKDVSTVWTLDGRHCLFAEKRRSPSPSASSPDHSKQQPKKKRSDGMTTTTRPAASPSLSPSPTTTTTKKAAAGAANAVKTKAGAAAANAESKTTLWSSDITSCLSSQAEAFRSQAAATTKRKETTTTSSAAATATAAATKDVEECTCAKVKGVAQPLKHDDDNDDRVATLWSSTPLSSEASDGFMSDDALRLKTRHDEEEEEQRRWMCSGGGGGGRGGRGVGGGGVTDDGQSSLWTMESLTSNHRFPSEKCSICDAKSKGFGMGMSSESDDSTVWTMDK